jgi:hypothetical protein
LALGRPVDNGKPHPELIDQDTENQAHSPNGAGNSEPDEPGIGDRPEILKKPARIAERSL